MRELDQMLTIAGGLIIAGAIGLLFSFGWSLLTASDRYSARWAQRLFGTIIVISALVAAFWIVFVAYTKLHVTPWRAVGWLFAPREWQVRTPEDGWYRPWHVRTRDLPVRVHAPQHR